MRITLPILLSTLAATAAAQEPTGKPATPAPAAAAAQAAAPKLDPALFDHFGAGITEGATVSVAAMLQNPKQHLDQTVRLRGLITEVCQSKGCWMHLGTQESPVMVKFLDYAFFVPKDASGRMTIVEGTLSMKQETVEETRHYLEDAGKHDEAKRVTEGRKILFFMASGAAIEKPADKAGG